MQKIKVMISVCIATYNGGKYIEEQLQSILKQIGKDDEVIVSDDGSTDDTIQKVEAFNDPRITILRHPKEKCKFLIDHSTHNFEYALNNSHGDIIFLSDQDDKWADNKVSTMLENLKTNDMVVSNCYVTDSNLNITHPSYFAIRRKTYGIWHLFWKTPILGSCMAFKRDVLNMALPFPRYGVGHDLWLAMVAMKWFKFTYIDDRLSYYRRHDGVVTVSGKKNNTSLAFKIEYRFYIFINILKRLYLHL